jgi:putative tryptophan/tyrosine transport system substrate-binding protein
MKRRSATVVQITIERRTLCVGIAGATLGQLLARAGAQERVRRIGFLANQFNAAIWHAFRERLQDHGWIEGQNMVFESRFAEGRSEQYIELAFELALLKVDVIVASGPPAVRAAQQATRTIPIIMTAVADPVEMGFVKSLAEPSGNITGVASTAGLGFLSKHLELARDALPFARRVGILFNEANPLNYATRSRPEILAAANALGLEVMWLPVRAAEDFAPRLTGAREQGTDAIIGIGDPLLFRHRELINESTEGNRLPVIWPTREYLAGRGLLSHGPSLKALMGQTATYVDKTLRGADPAITPVEQPTRYELVLNLKTAKALGLTIPPTLLARADEVIE